MMDYVIDWLLDIPLLNFSYQLRYKQKVMCTSSNEVPSQNQLAIDGVTHKLINMFKLFTFINVEQYIFSYSSHAPSRVGY